MIAMHVRPVLFAAVALWPALASAQDAAPVYPTPQAALEALFGAITAGNPEGAAAAIGPSASDLVDADDPVATADALADLTAAYLEGYRFVPAGPGALTIALGADGWPFPVPLLREGDGWRFDAEAARAEILARRIGGNELDVIDVMDAYVEIQREYRADGLYWPGEDSPVGDVAARASLDGFADAEGNEAGEPFGGYFFRILQAQGEAAPGGAMSYLVNGNMVAGHALLAVPAIYGETGVHTFMVGENGVVVQADLGPDSLDVAFGITAFDPGRGWELVTDE
jgi:hypothetical protein